MNELTIHFGSPLVVHQQQAPPSLVAWFKFQVDNFVFEGASMPASGQAVSQKSSATMGSGSMGTLSVTWKDSGGSTVKVDGPTTWASTDETIVQVTGQSGNPQITNIYAPGPVGSAEVHANADADLGQGVVPVTAVIAITVIAGQAVGGDITFTPTG